VQVNNANPTDVVVSNRNEPVAMISKWTIIIPVVLSGVVFVSAFVAGIASGLSGTASYLPSTLFGVTAVLSSRVYGLAGHPYAGYSTVKESLERSGMDPVKIAHGEFKISAFRDPVTLNSMLHTASTVDTCGAFLVFDSNNDQGMVDYIRGAFALFGINVAALYNFYFILLAIPIILYLLSFWRDYRACVLLFAFLCAAYTFMPSWIYRNNALISIANQRFLSILGIIPVLHILLLIARRSAALRWLDVATAIGQTAFVAFAYAIRSSAEWMYLAAATLMLFYLAGPAIRAARRRQWSIDSANTRRLTIAMLFAATALTIGAFRMLYLTAPCGEALNAHPVWHTLYYSLQFGPRWGSKLAPYNGLGKHRDWPNPVPAIDDASKSGDEMVYQAVKEYVQRHHLPYQTEPSIWYSTPESRRVTSEGLPLGSWATYEHVVRDMFFEFVRNNPRYVLENFLVIKPLLFVTTLAEYFKSVWSDLTPARSGVFVVMVLLIAIFYPARGDDQMAAARIGMHTGILLLCFAWSAVPSLIFYTNTQYVGDQASLGVTAIVIWIVYLLAAGATLVKAAVQLLGIGRRIAPKSIPR
jgi:hypothetical protein